MTQANYILIVLTTLIFNSCGPQKIQNGDQVDPVRQTDSAKLEQYFQWTEKIEYDKAYAYDPSLLLSNEKNRDTLMLLNFLTSNYESIKLYTDFPYQPADLVESIYAIDFNGDELLDIIYGGPTGGEQNITQLFLNKGDHFEKVFSGYQDIIKADFSNGRLNSFTLINPGCCADPQIVEYFYSVTYVDGKPAFIHDKTLGYLSQTEKPLKTFPAGKEFFVQTDNAKLRTECYFLNNVEHPVYGSNGNAIATYRLASKGKALGIKKDKDVEWIFVLMDSDNKIDSCDFPAFKEQPTELKGWMLAADTDWNKTTGKH